MKKYLKLVKIKRGDGFVVKVIQIPRDENEQADQLVPHEADYVIREVHEGICGNHSKACSLVHKLVRVGYNRPAMQKDAQSYVRVCDRYQRFSNIIRRPMEELTPMGTPWPFDQWGLDIVRPFPPAIRQLKFLIVGIDYFTKWVVAEPLVAITEKNVQSFFWKNIICRFEISRILINNLTTTLSKTSTNS